MTRALGILCGVGTLLREAQDAGCEVVGNIEVRPPFRTMPDVWDMNFPEASCLYSATDTDDDYYEADLALGHPPCGSHSVLGSTHSLDMDPARRAALQAKRSKRVGLLPLFVERVNTLKPRIFALDNLPKILATVAPEEWWRSVLPKYHLTFIVMKNWDYGTPQLRERLWVIGVRKPGKPFVFKPTTKRLPGPASVWEAISDLPFMPNENRPEIAHIHKAPANRPTGWYPQDGTTSARQTVTDLALGYLSIPSMTAWPYLTATGRPTSKFGRMRLDRERKSPVVSGGESLHHPLTGWPLTPRERARLMDWPDDFKLWDGERAFDRRYQVRLALFTGKAVPSRFPRYLIPQLLKHLKR